MIVVGADEVWRLLSIEKCIDLMHQAMVSYSNGQCYNPQRTKLDIPNSANSLLFMPASDSIIGAFGHKSIALNLKNSKADLPTVQGIVAVFDEMTGAPIGIVDGAAITSLRTAAATALATRELARMGANSHGILGTGAQAFLHAQSVCKVRSLDVIRIWGRNFEKAVALSERLKGSTNATVVAVRKASEAAACDIVTTASSACEPILLGDWLRPGAHINLVGSHSAQCREADAVVSQRAIVYVDSISAANIEAGDLILPLEKKEVDKPVIIRELGRLLNGDEAGRRADDQITVYKSLGMAVQDLYAAHYVLSEAIANPT